MRSQLLDLRLLEYFVAAAELEHVGKAAERLHISQSPLSRQIRRLEKDLNLELFIREKQRIRLTESGRWLLAQAQELLAHSQKLSQQAELRSRGQAGTLIVGFTSFAMWSGILPTLLRRFQTDFPHATVELRSMRSARQIEEVRSGSLDIGFITTPVREVDLELTCVLEEPSLLVFHEIHPLAHKRSISPSDLNAVSWILLAESFTPERQERFFAACASAGFTPHVVQKVTEPFTLLALVESGMGVGLIRSSARKYASPSLVFRELPWASFFSRIHMIRANQGRQRLADEFAAYVPQIKR